MRKFMLSFCYKTLFFYKTGFAGFDQLLGKNIEGAKSVLGMQNLTLRVQLQPQKNTKCRPWP